MSEAAANSKLAQIIETVKALTVIELSDLVHALEKEFGVSAAAVAAVGGPVAAVAEEAPTSFKVTLTVGGPNKIPVIKVVREVLGLGLAEAKAFVESAPKLIKEGVDKAAADDLVKKFKDVGAECKVEGV